MSIIDDHLQSFYGVSTISVLSNRISFYLFLARWFQRNRQPIVISNMIFSSPAMMNGMENSRVSNFCCMKQPLRPSPNIKPTDHAMLVIPLAADRSSLETTLVTQVCRAGMSICEMQNRPKRRMMLMVESVNAMKRRKTLDGRSVQIMVAIAPILSTSFDERTPLMLTMLQAKSMPPISSKKKSYLISQLREIALHNECAREGIECEVTAESDDDSFQVFLLDSGAGDQAFIFDLSRLDFFAVHQKISNVFQPAEHSVQAHYVGDCFIFGEAEVVYALGDEEACEDYSQGLTKQPAMLQYPKTAEVFLGTSSLLSLQSSTSCESADYQMGMKGPISPSVAEITPKMPLMVSMMMLSDSAQQSLVRILSSDPNMSVLILPILSAWVVRMREMRTSPKR